MLVAMSARDVRLILTGERQAGKSTLCRRLAESLRGEGFTVGGVWTETQKTNNQTELILHDVSTDAAVTLASSAWEPQGGPRQGRFQFSWEGIYAGIKSIGRGMNADLLIVDEIGPLELQGQGFFPVLHTLRRAHHCLLVVRPELVDQARHFLVLRDDYQTVTVLPENREQLVTELHERYAEAMTKAKWS
jgi:nucleoside-triphosphatase